MESYKTKSATIYDNGLFVGLALELAKSFGQVNYYSPWKSAFPKSNARMIGQGFETIQRGNEFWDIVPDTDIFIFPDVYDGDIQLHLEGLGHLVWGSRKGEEMELYRRQSKEHLKSVGVDVGPYEEIEGVAALRRYLQEHENQWVKISITRGDFETFHAPTYALVEPRLDELEWRLGAKKSIIKFIVEDAIDDAVETGYDGYCIDGVYPKSGICGVEIKDRGYLAAFKNTSEMPAEIIGVNEKLSDTYKNYRYRNFISTEIRITREGTPYMIDPCARLGSPPSELYTKMFTNLADIIWQGANGICVEPIAASKYGAQLLIHSSWADKNWQPIYVDEGIKENVSFRNVCMVDDQLYVAPQETGIVEIGSVVALGDSIEEVIERVREYGAKVQSYDLKIFPEVMDEAIEQIESLKSWGIDIT